MSQIGILVFHFNEDKHTKIAHLAASVHVDPQQQQLGPLSPATCGQTNHLLLGGIDQILIVCANAQQRRNFESLPCEL